MFWIASRKSDALNWSQAGVSLKADKAGVWWSRMTYGERINYAGFIENQKDIESKWDKQFGDRQNGLVIIGQELEKENIIKEMQECLCNEKEIRDMEVGLCFKDTFPEY